LVVSEFLRALACTDEDFGPLAVGNNGRVR